MISLKQVLCDKRRDNLSGRNVHLKQTQGRWSSGLTGWGEGMAKDKRRALRNMKLTLRMFLKL